MIPCSMQRFIMMMILLHTTSAFTAPRPQLQVRVQARVPTLVNKKISLRPGLPHYSMPQDDMFYDGYDEFIRNLQEDLENHQSDIYNSNRADDQEYSNNHPNNRNRGGSSYHLKRRNNRRQRNIKQQRKTYRRDPNDDYSISVDEKEVNRLIETRTKAQQVRNYDLADHILSELNESHGVYIWDRDGLWTATPIAPSRRYKANTNGGNNNGTSQNSSRVGNGNGGENRFGRHGHDYIQIGDKIDESICALKLHEIHDLIAKRLEFKLIRKYAQADEIQAQLYANNVRIHDKLKQWRGDGGVFADIEGTLSGRPFVMNEHSEAIADTDHLNEIENLVHLRNEARTSSNYDEADRLRQILWDTYRVAVDDKSRTYSKGGDFGIDGTFFWTDNGPINPRKGRNPSISRDWRIVGGMYTVSSKSLPLREEDGEEVINLIHDRLEAKRVKDYEVADLIMDHLYREYQISVDDDLRQWSVGGEFDEDAIKSKQKRSPTAADGKMNSSYIRTYNRRGGAGELADKEILLVEAMVARRAEEMARFNKQAASSIRKGLRNKYYVIIDDMNCEWHVRGNDFILSPKLEGHLPKNIQDSREEIEKLIRERSQARGEGDFSRADEIRSDLLETYSVRMDDRVKEWSFVTVEDDKVRETCRSEKPVDVSDMEVESEQSLSKLTVIQLKSKLREAGLPVSGRKAELIERILQR